MTTAWFFTYANLFSVEVAEASPFEVDPRLQAYNL
ncbi:hypothetical protein ABIA94_008487 [Bradyrhizobium sp. LA7.1]